MTSGWCMGRSRSLDMISRALLYRLFLISHRVDSGMTLNPHVSIRNAGNSWIINGHRHCQSEVGNARIKP
jgi:hypothetical protein